MGVVLSSKSYLLLQNYILLKISVIDSIDDSNYLSNIPIQRYFHIYLVNIIRKWRT